MLDSFRPIHCSTTGLPVPHQHPEFAQVDIHWITDAIQPSHPVALFSFCLQSFPASGSFLMSWLFTSGCQSIKSFSTRAFKEYSGADFPLDWLVWSWCPRDSQVFSSTTVWKHQFFGAQPSFWSNSHILKWLLPFHYVNSYPSVDKFLLWYLRMSLFFFCFLVRYWTPLITSLSCFHLLYCFLFHYLVYLNFIFQLLIFKNVWLYF